jgi:chaperone required for assembly of F1-ATPase
MTSDHLFDPVKSDGDPVRLTREKARKELPKRFYSRVEVVENESQFAVEIDGRMVKTPGQQTVLLPVRQLAQDMAGEWDAQERVINLAAMPITRLINAALDGVADRIDLMRQEIVQFAATDLLCYRLAEPERLAARQRDGWDPVLAWCAENLKAPLIVTLGIVHCEQPAASLNALVRTMDDLTPIATAALHGITTLTGSAVLALAVWKGAIEPERAWALAHIDEDWNRELWGVDEQANQRRAGHLLEMEAACRVLALAR